jgi:hypothetical protein
VGVGGGEGRHGEGEERGEGEEGGLLHGSPDGVMMLASCLRLEAAG